MRNLKIMLMSFFIGALLQGTNVFAGNDFEIIEVTHYENRYGLRTAKVTVKNIDQMSRVVSPEDFVGITADGKRIRAKYGSSNRVNGNNTYTLMLHFGRQTYPVEEIDFY